MGYLTKNGEVGTWMCMALVCSSMVLQAVQAKHGPPEKLVLYQHEDRVPPNNNVVVTATPSGNLSTFEFGTLSVFANVVRDGVSNTSTVLGQAVGIVTFSIDLSFSLTITFTLNTSSLNGSITAQGTKNQAGSGELAITGGTGDFRWARGYDDTQTLNAADENDVVFMNTMYLRY